MSEHETDPKRAYAAPGADPATPAPAPTGADAATPQAASAPEDAAGPGVDPSGHPSASEPTTAGTTDTVPGVTSDPAAESTQRQPTYAHGDPVYPTHPYASSGYPTYAYGMPGQPTHPYAQPNQSGWGDNPPHGNPPHGGSGQSPYAGSVPHYGPGTGNPSYGWPQSPPSVRPGRLAKAAIVGVGALALMVGSGITGAVATVALHDNHSQTKTYTAAPIINSADLPGIADAVQDSVVSITTGTGEGSGVILSSDGYVLTNNHVVASASGNMVNVAFADGKTARAKIIGTDPKSDIAVVKAQGASGLKAAKFGDSDAMRVGDTVLALGSPLGLQGSVTAGIISAKDRTIRAGGNDPRTAGAASISGLLQTDAPINPGNSGGALVNTRGEVIGINTAIATDGQGSGNIGLGFAIPSNKAKTVAEALKKGQKVSHPYLGVSIGTAENGGALVDAVAADSPAAAAGLQRGDVVTKFGDKQINTSEDLVAAVQAGKVGDRLELTYVRNGVEKHATVTLAEAS